MKKPKPNSRVSAALAGLLFLAALPALAQSPAGEGTANAPLPALLEWTTDNKAALSAGFRGLGARPSEKEAFRSNGRLKILTTRGTRPARVLLTELLPPVADQGEQGSCVGWSTAYYFYTALVAKQLKLGPEVIRDARYQFSPAFIYNQGNGGKNEGMPVGEGFKLLKEKGCATLLEMPYDVKDFTRQPPSDAHKRADQWKARQVVYLYEGKIRRESGAANVEALKTFLAETRQPFVTAIPIFKDFPKSEVPPATVYNLTVEPKKEHFMGFHAVTIVGYDDGKKAFRMVNSWSPAWGDKGFLWLAEEFVHNWAIDGFTVVPGGAVARDAQGRWTRHITIEAPGSGIDPDIRAPRLRR